MGSKCDSCVRKYRGQWRKCISCIDNPNLKSHYIGCGPMGMRQYTYDNLEDLWNKLARRPWKDVYFTEYGGCKHHYKTPVKETDIKLYVHTVEYLKFCNDGCTIEITPENKAVVVTTVPEMFGYVEGWMM